MCIRDREAPQRSVRRARGHARRSPPGCGGAPHGPSRQGRRPHLRAARGGQAGAGRVGRGLRLARRQLRRCR
eukprot:2521046-Alexandrium_andersonii.AAC.1